MAALEKVQSARTFVEESYVELQKVTWPDYEQLKNATFIVIVFVMIIATIIWFMDFTVRNVLEMIMRIFGA